MKTFLGGLIGLSIGFILGLFMSLSGDWKLMLHQLNAQVKDELRLAKSMYPHKFYIPHTQLMVIVRKDGTGILHIMEEKK
jgi:hypothetical protein